MTTVFVTHDLMEIPCLASRVVVLHNGQIIKAGMVGEILGSEVEDRRVLSLWPA